MSEFPRKPHEVLIPREVIEKMVYFPASNAGYPRFKPEYAKRILNELQKVYPSFTEYEENQGAIIWFESDTPYIGIAISILEFTYSFFDIYGPSVLKSRKRLTMSRLNQQDLATLISTKSEWREKAIQETLRRLCFSVEGSIKHRRHMGNVFLDILRNVNNS
jgi:hypothetical protein